jgi:hypothetical protein
MKNKIEIRITADGVCAWLFDSHGFEYNIFKFKKIQPGKELLAASAVLRGAGAASWHPRRGLEHFTFAALCETNKNLAADISQIEHSGK